MRAVFSTGCGIVIGAGAEYAYGGAVTLAGTPAMNESR